MLAADFSPKQLSTVKRLSHFSSAALVFLCSFSLETGFGQASAATTADLKVYAVDANGNRLSNLVAGQYVALIVEADTGVFPDKLAAGLSAKAELTTRILGQIVKYSVNLPTANASASSRRDPTIGSPTSGQKLGEDLQNNVWSERLDFYIPAEAPQGTVKFIIRANAASAKSVSRTFTFNLVRPQP